MEIRLRTNPTMNKIYIYIADNGVLPSILGIQNTFTTPGQLTSIGISKTVNKKLGEPYNDCIKSLDTYKKFNTTFYKTIINSNIKYTQSSCIELCFDYYLAPVCSCKVPYGDIFIGDTDRPICYKGFDQLNCGVVFIENFNQWKECYKMCPLECDEVIFDKSIQSYIDTSLSNNQSKIRVYYRNMEYESYSEIPKISFINLVSNLGGTCGLFLGLSLISFLQFIEYILRLIHISVIRLFQ